MCAVVGVCGGQAYSSLWAWRRDPAVWARAATWFLVTLTDKLLTATLVALHGLRARCFCTRLVGYVAELQAVNALTRTAPAPHAAGAALVWALVGAGVLLALFSHVFYSTLIVINDNDGNARDDRRTPRAATSPRRCRCRWRWRCSRTDMLFYPLVFVSAVSTLLSYVFVYAQNVVKAVVSLVHAALALELSRAVRGARRRLASLVRRLAASGEILARVYCHACRSHET